VQFSLIGGLASVHYGVAEDSRTPKPCGVIGTLYQSRQHFDGQFPR
jgi:hypothetical protein